METAISKHSIPWEQRFLSGMVEPSICEIVRVIHSPASSWLVYPLEFIPGKGGGGGSKQAMNANDFHASDFVNDKNHARKKPLLAR